MAKKLKGKKVLITGAAQGIGLCTAEHFAKAGSVLLITDIDKAALEKAASDLRAHGAEVHRYVYDVGDQKKVQTNINKMLADVGEVDILINNAGVGHNDELIDTPLDTWKKLVDVNFWGPLYHMYALLPLMKERGEGQIVNVSSGQAFFRLPTWGAYAAIKTALGVMSEILHFEVRKFGIRVTTVYPFMVDTGFYNGVEPETFGGRLSMKLIPYYSMKPETVGKIIFKATKKRNKVEKVSLFNDVGFYSQFVPFASDVMARASSMFLTKPRS